MDEAAIREVQKEAADALLDVGVSIPIKEWSLPFRRKPLRLRVTLRRPRMNGAIKLMRICLGIGVTSREMESYTPEENMRFMALHGVESLAHAGLYDCPGGRIETYSSQSDRMATARAGRRTLPHGRLPDVLPPDGDGPFYEYYQIGRADEPDEAETEPKKEGELRTEYEPSHSPFGFIWQVASATGWSVEYILKESITRRLS